MTLFVRLCLVLISISWITSAQANTRLQVSTLNLKWFGIGGFMWNTPDMEFRRDNIRKFIDQTLPDADIIVFTEVVETEALREVVAHRMDCASYEGTWSRHQHVMICYDRFQLRAEKYDNDYIIDTVDLGSGGLRPAAQAKICKINGDCFLQVIGVHLAAGRKSEKRLEQVKLINADLVRHQDLLPTIVTGDFNSYITSQSGLEEDDIDMFEKALSDRTKEFRSVTRHITTYNSGEWARSYDHIITTADIQTTRTWGYEACEKKPDLSKTFIPYDSFRRHYTDHCPVTADITIIN